VENEVIPEGKIKISDGRIIDRADACFSYREHPKTDKLLFDHKKTCYVKDENGTLRRWPPKVKKNKKINSAD
jgi:hypothetical protein